MPSAMPQPFPQTIDSLTASERLRVAESVLTEAGFPSLLPPQRSPQSAFPEPEARALAAVGLQPTDDVASDAHAARAVYATSFLDLFKQADSVSDVAARLGLDPSRIRQRLRERSLLAVELNGERRLPRFQFEDDIEVPGLARVLAATAGMAPLPFAMWFLSATPDLEGANDTPLSPREWLLRTGEVDAVLDLARDL